MATRIKLPIDDATLNSLSIREPVLISGVLLTARDAAHRYLVTEKLDRIPREVVTLLKCGAVYHCGPVVEHLDGNRWKIISAGPTTSKRMEPFTPQLIERFGVRAILGKGGMLSETHKALVKNRCVYISVVGGAAALLAERVVAVRGVHKLEFGLPEALWLLEVKDLPGVVSMDAKGGCMIDEIFQDAKKKSRL